MLKEDSNGVLVEELPEEIVDYNLAYIKKLAKDLKLIKPSELFFAIILHDIYELRDDIDKITLKDIQWIGERYREYLMDKDATLVNPKWLKR